LLVDHCRENQGRAAVYETVLLERVILTTMATTLTYKCDLQLGKKVSPNHKLSFQFSFQQNSEDITYHFYAPFIGLREK
jgi:hypothetical protein